MRRIIKRVVFGACLVMVAPIIGIVRLEALLRGGEGLFRGFAQSMALLPGSLGTYLRAAYYFGTLEACSWEVHVGFGSLFTHRGGRLAARVSMGSYCVIGHATIESDVRLASRVSIPSGKRQHLSADGRLSACTHFGRVRIGEFSWIGEGAIVLADVGSRSIVSAGAVVINEVPSDCIAGGNPARVIKALTESAAADHCEA